MKLQDVIDRGGIDVRLTPGEYEGPLVISRPCVLQGSGATVWCEHGPVVTIRADHVRIDNLRIEVTGTGGSMTALACMAHDTLLREVEVYGAVSGLGIEDGGQSIPRTLSLGTFAAGHENVFIRHIYLPAPTNVTSYIAGVRVEPDRLPAGKAELRVVTDQLPPGTCVWGDIVLQSGVRRRIYLRGCAVEGAPIVMDRSSDVGSGASVRTPRANRTGLRKGERRSVRGSTVRVSLEGVTKNMDCYVFLLDSADKVRRDRDLVFFGNRDAYGGAVRLLSEQQAPGAEVELQGVPASVQRIVVAFSLYEAVGTGDVWTGRTVVVNVDEDTFAYALKAAPKVRTITAVHLYRRGSEWRMWTTDHQTEEDISGLCQLYGVHVE